MPTQTEKSRQSAGLFCVSDADNDATDPVPIRWCPNPPDSIHDGNRGRVRAVTQTMSKRSIIPRSPHIQEQQAPGVGPAVTQDMYLYKHRSLESYNPFGCQVPRA